jgi:polyisoprenoid-binding protein YceI
MKPLWLRPPSFASSSALCLALLVPVGLACKDGNGAPRATSAPASQPVALATAPAAVPPPAAGTRRLSFGPSTSSIEFVGRKITGQHVGRFEQFSGTIDLDPAALDRSVVRVDIDMGSVKVEPDGLQKHLRSDEFFDVAKYPKATFTSTSIRAGEGGAPHVITGDLFLHGEKRSISFPAKLSLTPEAVSASADFSINRKDFKIMYPGVPDDLIRDDVTIKLALRAPRS